MTNDGVSEGASMYHHSRGPEEEVGSLSKPSPSPICSDHLQVAKSKRRIILPLHTNLLIQRGRGLIVD